MALPSLLLMSELRAGREEAASDVPIAHQLTEAVVPERVHITARASIQTPGGHASKQGRYISWKEHIIDDAARSGIPNFSGGDGLKMADLDRDGHLDIVSVHEGDVTYDGIARGQVRIAYGTGNPEEWELVTLAEGPDAGAAEDVAIADFNGDGYLDVIAACEIAHLILFENPGTGRDIRGEQWKHVIPPVTAGREGWIRVFHGDFNGDGRLEIVAANKGAQNPGLAAKEGKEVSLFEITGDPLNGEWAEHVLAKVAIPDNARAVDLNGDGHLDVFGSVRGEQSVFWLENLGGRDFDFKLHPIHVGFGSESMPVRGIMADFADLNGDGRLDIVLLDAIPRHNMVWLEQPKDPTLPGARWRIHHIGSGAPDSLTAVLLSDINGDGHLDVMTGSYSGRPRDRDGPELTAENRLGRIAWFENPGNPYEAWIRHDISRRKRGMFDQFVPVDLNRDGAIDFVGTRGNSFPNDGVFWLEQVRTEEPVRRFQPARDPSDESEEMPLPIER